MSNSKRKFIFLKKKNSKIRSKIKNFVPKIFSKKENDQKCFIKDAKYTYALNI